MLGDYINFLHHFFVLIILSFTKFEEQHRLTVRPNFLPTFFFAARPRLKYDYTEFFPCYLSLSLLAEEAKLKFALLILF